MFQNVTWGLYYHPMLLGSYQEGYNTSRRENAYKILVGKPEGRDHFED